MDAPLRGTAEIGLKVGAVLDKHKMGKHYDLTIANTSFAYRRKAETIPPKPASMGSM